MLEGALALKDFKLLPNLLLFCIFQRMSDVYILTVINLFI